ncbi:MAG: hypothetical protein WCG04_06325, partial [Alphaproteobacteria bacterium]
MKFSRLSLLCFMLGTSAITTSAMASDIAPMHGDDAAIQRGKLGYARLDRADDFVQHYNGLVEKGDLDKDKNLAAKTIKALDSATKLIGSNRIKVKGKATKETTKWYLNFAMTKGQNLKERMPTTNGIDDILRQEFNFNEQGKNDAHLKENEADKLR